MLAFAEVYVMICKSRDLHESICNGWKVRESGTRLCSHESKMIHVADAGMCGSVRGGVKIMIIKSSDRLTCHALECT